MTPGSPSGSPAHREALRELEARASVGGADPPSASDLDAAAAAVREAVGEIRSRPGHETFLQPPGWSDVVRAASKTTVIYVVAAELGGVALVLTPGTIDVATVWLGALTRAAVEARLRAFAAAHGARHADPDGWRRTLDVTLRWLWEAAMRDVVAAAGWGDDRHADPDRAPDASPRTRGRQRGAVATRWTPSRSRRRRTPACSLVRGKRPSGPGIRALR